METLGHACHPVDLPGNGNGADRTPAKDVSLDLYAAYLSGVLDRIGRPVVVGHSSGGIIASQLAENECERVRGLVYVCGMMLPSGMSYADLVEAMLDEAPEVVGINPHLEWSADDETSRVVDGAALEIFYHDCDADLARAAASRLKPHPRRGREIAAYLSADRFGRIPRAYIEATRDRSVVPAAQARMQELVPGAARFAIDTGHAPLLAKPAELAAIIHRAVDGFGLDG